MTRGTARGHRNTFLLELTIAIGIFAVGCAVCIRLFVGAYTLSQRSEALGQAVTAAQNAAEIFKYTDGDLADTARILGGTVEDDMVVVLLDNSLSPVQTEPSRYILQISAEHSGSLTTGDILVTLPQGDEIFRLSVAKCVR